MAGDKTGAQPKAHRNIQLVKIGRQALADGACLWSCRLAVPMGETRTIVADFRLMLDLDGRLTNISVSGSMGQTF